MSTSAVALQLTLSERDDLVDEAAYIARSACKGNPRLLANALGVTYERGRQLCMGDKTGFICRGLEGTAALAAIGAASAWIVGVRVTMLKTMLKRMDEVELQAQLAEAQAAEERALSARAAARDEAATIQAEREHVAALEGMVAAREVLRWKRKGRTA